MRCLITGGAGFIGSHIQDKVLELNHEVAILDNFRSGKKENINQKSKFYQVDVCDKTAISQVFNEFKPEAIFHLAAQNEVPYSMNHPYEDQNINIVGMINLLEASKEFGINKFVYSNTGGAYYGEVSEDKLPISENELVVAPSSFYGVSKAAAESYLRLYGTLYQIPWVSLRYSNVYGPRQDGNKEAGVVAIFTSKLLNQEQPTINGNGSITRDYIFVGDVVEANIAALNYSKNDAFNVATGIETSTKTVFDEIESVLKTGIKPNFGPTRSGDVYRNSLSVAKAEKLMSWKPQKTFKEGVKLTIEYYLHQK